MFFIFYSVFFPHLTPSATRTEREGQMEGLHVQNKND